MDLTASSSAAPSARPLNILYADDLRQLREFMGIMLGREGHQVQTADDGAAALEQLSPACNAFDLLITDHHMPRLNGLDLVRAVRNLPFAGKIIVFSSELSELVHDQYRALGVDLILPKPISPSLSASCSTNSTPASPPPPDFGRAGAFRATNPAPCRHLGWNNRRSIAYLTGIKPREIGIER